MNSQNVMLRVQNDRPDLVPRSLGTLSRLEVVLEHDIDEHYHYKPGETLSGKVKVHVRNGDVDLQGLKINISGICSVGWQVSGESVLSSQEEYINDSMILAPLDGSTALNLSTGCHDFDFSYQLPNRLPSSFIGKYGSVTYVLKASAFDKRAPLICSEPFLVANRYFPWSSKEMLQPQEANAEKRYKAGFFRSGKIKVHIALPRSGYYPGDDIKLQVQVINQSPRTVLGIQASLMMQTSFTAQTNVHTHIQVLAKKYEQWELVRGEGRRWNNAILSVPMYTPESQLDGCDIIEISFELMVKIEVKKKHGESDLLLTLPIIIGPLTDVTDPAINRNRPRKPAKTIDRRTLEHMDMKKLLDLQQEDSEDFKYEQPLNDGTLRVNPLYNKQINTGDEVELSDNSEVGLNTKL